MSKNKQVPSLEARRRALRKIGGLTAFGLVPGLTTMLSAQTAEAAGSYKAIVCVFLFGGNDANNMIVPTDAPTYATYLAARGGIGTTSNGALALPNAGQSGGVLPLANTNLGVHPSMPELQSLWASNNAALLLNVGNLVQPLASVAAYSSGYGGPTIPVNLFSHFDQQQQMQMTSTTIDPTTGWAGRLADSISIASGSMPVGISAAGNAQLLAGASSVPIVVPQKGTLQYNGFNSSSPSQARLSSLQSLFGISGNSTFMSSVGSVQSDSVTKANSLKSILQSAAAVSGNFPLYSTSGLSQQLAQVALLIQAAANGTITAPSQQIFFVSLGGFDTHNNELAIQGPLLAQLSSGLNGFYNTMVQIGQSNNVVAFTLSDFARTLQPASGGGTDHAWGSHHIIVGGTGAVKGGQVFGTLPNLTLGGPSDVTQEGRWLPKYSIDQYGATLASWLGASSGAISNAFPNLVNFSTSNLGFLA